MKKLTLCIVLLLLAAGCSHPKLDENVAFMAEAPPAAPQANEMQAEEPKDQKPSETKAIARKLIRNGRIEFETNDADAMKRQIFAAAKAFNGYIATEKETKGSSEIEYQMVVRVPAAHFDQFLASATKGVTEFRGRAIDINDVTEEFLDTEARMKSKKEIESRYRQLLGKATTVKDILEIEKELGEVRTEIESTEGRLKLLADQVQYSTLHLTFYKTVPATSTYAQDIRDAFSSGWENLQVFIVVVISIWPFLLLAIVATWLINYFSKRRSRERALKAAPEAPPA